MSNCGITTLKIPFECEYIVQGDTISETSFEVIEDGLDLTSEGVEITIVIKQGNDDIINYSIGNGITVVDSENFKIDKVESFDNDLPDGYFEGDFKISQPISEEESVLFTYSRIGYNIIKNKG